VGNAKEMAGLRQVVEEKNWLIEGKGALQKIADGRRWEGLEKGEVSAERKGKERQPEREKSPEEKTQSQRKREATIKKVW